MFGNNELIEALPEIFSIMICCFCFFHLHLYIFFSYNTSNKTVLLNKEIHVF